ncbi:MAG TPA: biotin/lipoyl-binding protein, partial [bacterium]|nr:biotin/lipoyl-binding protein [bacterium]
MKKALVLLAIACLLGFLGFKVNSKVKEVKAKSESNSQKRGATSVAVEVAPVRRATVREIGRFTGSLIPRSSFVVAPKIAGRLERLTVDTGDSVANGQLVAELEDEEYIQQVQQARAELAVANASVAECKSALEVS